MTIYGYRVLITRLPKELIVEALNKIASISFNGYELYCLDKVGMGIDNLGKPYERFLKFSKAIMGETWFDEILGEMKNRVIEGQLILHTNAYLFRMILNDLKYLQ